MSLTSLSRSRARGAATRHGRRRSHALIHVVLAVGGSSMLGDRGTGDDTLIAFALPD